MKHLRSSSEDLRQLFEQSITVREIAEPLASFDLGATISELREFMHARDYDVVGVRRDGMVSGYVARADLRGDALSERALQIDPEICLPDRAPLLDVFEVLQRHGFVFVTISGTPWGIVTRGDLQKAPVRMWLFGLVSLAEMQMLRLVRLCYPNEEWKDTASLSAKRLEEAERVFEKRQARKSQTDLTDCLQFCDKATLLNKNDKLFQALGWKSRRKADDFFSEVEDLRNHLAHSQDIVTHHWPKLAELVVDLEAFFAALRSDWYGSPR